MRYRLNGKRHQRRIGTVSEKQAEQYYVDIIREIEENELFERKEKILFKDFSIKFIETYSKIHKKSYKDDQCRLKKINQFFEGKHLHEIKKVDIEDYKAKRIKTVKGSTVNRDLALLKTIYNKAIEWEYSKENPVNKIQFFREEKRVRYLLLDGELQRFIDVLENKNLPEDARKNEKTPLHIEKIVKFLMYTGMRKGEVIGKNGLRWSQVDEVNRLISLEENKSGKRQNVNLNDSAMNILNSIEKKFNYVFTHKDGKQINNIKTAWKTLLRRACIENFKIHDLRHCFASYMAMSGASQNDIKEALRHSNLEMTTRYTHLSDNHLKDSVSKLDKFVGTYLGNDNNKINIKLAGEK